MVMCELLWIVGIGLGTGIPAALAASRIFESRLFGVHGRDAATVAAATLVITLTAVAAAWWPACRAYRIDPLDALRYESGKRWAPGKVVVIWGLGRVRAGPQCVMA